MENILLWMKDLLVPALSIIKPEFFRKKITELKEHLDALNMMEHNFIDWVCLYNGQINDKKNPVSQIILKYSQNNKSILTHQEVTKAVEYAEIKLYECLARLEKDEYFELFAKRVWYEYFHSFLTKIQELLSKKFCFCRNQIKPIVKCNEYIQLKKEPIEKEIKEAYKTHRLNLEIIGYCHFTNDIDYFLRKEKIVDEDKRPFVLQVAIIEARQMLKTFLRKEEKTGKPLQENLVIELVFFKFRDVLLTGIENSLA